MAEDKNRKKDSDEDTESQGSSPAKKGGHGSGLMMPMVIVGLVIGLAGLGFGGYAIFNNMQSAEAATEEEVATEEEEPSEEAPEETNIYFEAFPEGVVNLVMTEDSMFTYLKYGISIEVDAESTCEIIEESLPKLTSKVSELMSNRSWPEISTSAGREQLSREIMAGVNDALEEGECVGIYFTTFVAQ